MPAAALALVLVSALLHASWNALTKNTPERLCLLWLAMVFGSGLAFAAAAVMRVPTLSPNGAIGLLVVSSAVHAGYFFALSQAYQTDLSLAYPLARGLAVGLAPLGAWWWLSERPNMAGGLGIACVVGGGLWVGLSGRRSTGEASLAAKKGMRWALLGGCLVATYSLIDAQGARRLEPVVYVGWMGLGSALVMSPLMWRRRVALRFLLREHRWAVVAVATMSLGAYGLVLTAFRLSATGYVVACRELSIVASVVVGRFWLNEREWSQRLIGAAAIVAGAAIITLFG